MKIDKTKIDNIVVDNIRGYDHPDYVDAYIESADYMGVEMTEEQLEKLNEDSEFVHECVWNHLH